MEVSYIVLFSLLQEGWSRAKKKVLGWPAEKLVQITGVKLWYGDSNLNPGKRDKCALCGCPLPSQPGGDTEPYSNSHWCRCKTNHTLSFFFSHPQMELVIILSLNYHRFGVVNCLAYLLPHIGSPHIF